MKQFLISSFLLMFPFCFFAQAPLQDEQLRIQVWAELDPAPGRYESLSEEEKNNQADDFHKIFGYAIGEIKKISPYLIAGMLDGWNFIYTPYDKARHVEEYWEFEQIREFNSKVNRLEFYEPLPKDGKLLAWVYCSRTFEQKREFERWNSVIHPKIHGQGKCSVELGFEGIKNAVGEAAKDAVREHWRTQVKNKPKEISGKVLLIRTPRIYIKSGQYVVDFDFFLDTERILNYNYY